MASNVFSYYDDWKSTLLTCPLCGWKGTFLQGSVEHHSELMDSSCPKCEDRDGTKLAIVSYPTLDEVEANWDKLSDAEKEEFGRRKNFVDRFEASCLKSANKLPDLAEDEITLVWDFEEGDSESRSTIIRFGDRIVWTEPAVWEGAERFAEVLAILKEKYGDRLIDVEPTEASSAYLFGDRLASIDRVNEERRKLR